MLQQYRDHIYNYPVQDSVYLIRNTQKTVEKGWTQLKALRG